MGVVVHYVNQLLKCVSYRVTEVEYSDTGHTASYNRMRSMISFERIEKLDEWNYKKNK